MKKHVSEMLPKMSAALALRVVAAITLFVLNVNISRALGAESSGYYFLSVSIVFVLSALSRLGFDQVITRYTSIYTSSSDNDSVNGMYAYLIARLGLILFFCSTALFLFSGLLSNNLFHKPLLSEPLRFISFGVFFLGLLILHGHFFQGCKSVVKFQVCQSVGYPLILLMLLFFMFFFWGEVSVNQVAFLHLTSLSITLLLAFYWWWSKSEARWVSGYRARDLWQAAMPMWGVASLSLLMTWGAPLLLGIWGSSSSVAIFHNAFRTANLTTLVLMAINSIAAPKFSELYYRGDIESLKRISVFSARAVVFLAAPIFSCFFLFPDHIMGLFGDEFKEGASVLIVLALGQMFNVATGSVLLLLNMTGHEKYVFKSSLLSASVMLILGFILIPLFGVIGAAVSYSVSLILQMILCTYCVQKVLGFMPINIFSKC